MKIIKEHIEFQKGGNPYKTMRLGIYKKSKIGDKFEVLKNLISLKSNIWVYDKFDSTLIAGQKIEIIEASIITHDNFLIRITDSENNFEGDVWWDRVNFEKSIGTLIKRIYH